MAHLDVSLADCIWELETLPEGFLTIAARDLHTLLPSPTLIHLPGRKPEPLFVSILLHGNETTGLQAVQKLLIDYAQRPLPRALSIFVGNVAAAREGLRRLDRQMDFNRAWPGTVHGVCEETTLLAAVTERMAARRVFTSVDLHNNTGLNPHYACINRLDRRFLHLASLFGRLVIYFTHPRGTQTAAFAALCPAVTLECGKPDSASGAAHASEFLDACLHLTEIPDRSICHESIDLYRTVAQVTVPERVSFGFGEGGLDLQLSPDLDHLNFTELVPGSVFGSVKPGFSGFPVVAWDESGADRAADYFEIGGGRLLLRRPLMPSMLTQDERIIRQDCLCYLMERISAGSELLDEV